MILKHQCYVEILVMVVVVGIKQLYQKVIF